MSTAKKLQNKIFGGAGAGSAQANSAGTGNGNNGKSNSTLPFLLPTIYD